MMFTRRYACQHNLYIQTYPKFQALFKIPYYQCIRCCYNIWNRVHYSTIVSASIALIIISVGRIIRKSSVHLLESTTLTISCIDIYCSYAVLLLNNYQCKYENLVALQTRLTVDSLSFSLLVAFFKKHIQNCSVYVCSCMYIFESVISVTLIK